MITQSVRGRILAAIAVLAACGSVLADETSVRTEEALEFGRRIYMEGTLSSGESLVATVSQDVEITGDFVVCGECHRKSGLGASEGEFVTPPVVGSILYEDWQLPTSRPPAPPVLRPAYDYDSLAASIRDGISSTGEEFSMLMPRYPLSDEDMGYLIAYLDSLSAGPDPGVTETDIHFATILTDDVTPEARKALLDVMEQFIVQKNTETRYESKRASSGPWHKDWMFKRYRKWVLHTWELSGPESSWRAQLDALYADEPVFAVTNGVTGGSWAPVHEFCEQNGLPCLFPTTNLPVVDRQDFYSVYLSKGITLEAEAIAQQLIEARVPPEQVLQVYLPNNAESRMAAAALEKILGPEAALVALTEFDTANIEGRSLVAWLGVDEVNSIDVTASAQIYLSGSLLRAQEASLNESVRTRARLVYSTELPGMTESLLARSTGWFRFKRIHAPDHEAIQANAYFTMKMVGGGLFAIGNYFSRDFFIESIEHMVDNAIYTSIYPYMSLAPRQRFVSKGVKIAKFDEDNVDELVTVVDWLIPDFN